VYTIVMADYLYNEFFETVSCDCCVYDTDCVGQLKLWEDNQEKPN
jgi:hypothetical protein